MKQHISIAQLNELTDKQKEKLREWWKPQIGDLSMVIDNSGNQYEEVVYDAVEDGNDYFYRWFNLDHKVAELELKETQGVKKSFKVFPLPNIGQMIEFIEDNADFYSAKEIFVTAGHLWTVTIKKDQLGYYDSKESLCDALWEVVKLLLSKDESNS